MQDKPENAVLDYRLLDRAENVAQALKEYKALHTARRTISNMKDGRGINLTMHLLQLEEYQLEDAMNRADKELTTVVRMIEEDLRV